MLAAEFIAVVDVDVARIKPGAVHRLARHEDQFVIEKYMAGKALALLRGMAEGDVDEADGQPAVDHALLAGPQGHGDARGMAAEMFDPLQYKWSHTPLGKPFDGCIRNIVHNSKLYDLADPGLFR